MTENCRDIKCELNPYRSSVVLIGSQMGDGTIYAGFSPDTGKPMFAAPTDAPMGMDSNEAERYAKGLEVGDKKDFRVPTEGELNILFKNRNQGALKSTFNLSGLGLTGYYRSSTFPHSDDFSYVQKFSNGNKILGYREGRSSIRCVR